MKLGIFLLCELFPSYLNNLLKMKFHITTVTIATETMLVEARRTTIKVCCSSFIKVGERKECLHYFRTFFSFEDCE